MSSYFPPIQERRYTDYKRRYSAEYFFDSRRSVEHPNVSFRYATLASARQKACRAIDLYGCTTVRIFDHKTGQYLYTYRKSTAGIAIHEGCVK